MGDRWFRLSEDIVGKEGRGSWAIPLTAIPYIKESISSYFKAPINQANIKLSLERYHSVPWEGIRLWINSCLSDHPRYKEIRPSAKQIRRIGRDVIEITEILRSALGDKIMPLKYRAKSGDYRDVTWGAGSLYEADPHDIDLHFIDKETMMPIGRGKLILVVDRASTMITGFDFSSDDPDFDYMAQSFDCAFSNKPKWCLDNLGHTIGDNDWPLLRHMRIASAYRRAMEHGCFSAVRHPHLWLCREDWRTSPVFYPEP